MLPGGMLLGRPADEEERAASVAARPAEAVLPFPNVGENAFAAAVRKLLPNGVADKCRIQVIVQMAGENGPGDEEPAPSVEKHSPENEAECRSESYQ